MKILLLQNMLYIPALGGGNKGNRELMERLAANGHSCKVFAPAQSPHGPQNRQQVLDELARNHVQPTASSETAEVFVINGVEVHALHDTKRISNYLSQLAQEEKFSCILVGADDPTQTMLAVALEIAPDRVVLLARSTFYLPFGPVAALANAERCEQIRRVRTIICNSNYVLNYIQKHLPPASAAVPFPELLALPLPVMGLKIPEQPLGAGFNSGFVTLINPSAIKGIAIFLELARRFPEVPFAAVPTWATRSEDRRELELLPNVTILPSSQNVDSIYAQTRLLLAPSLWDEAFGRVVVEAMLHGIPVLASNVGGLPEAKLGVPYVLPVNQIQSYKDEYDQHRLAIPTVPAQDIAPWEQALRELLLNSSHYSEISRHSREAATQFVSSARFADFEAVLSRVSLDASEKAPTRAQLIEQLTPEQRTALALKALNNRKKSPASPLSPAPATQNSLVAHDYEAKIIQIWSSVLKVPSPKRTDNFFDLGGHSLLAIAMFAKLNEAFHVDLPLGLFALFLENPTIAALTSTLEAHLTSGANGLKTAVPTNGAHSFGKLIPTNDANDFKTLILLREGSVGEPLFLAHAHDGNALTNLPLASQIETGRPIYGFQSPPSATGDGYETTIEGLAARYVKDLKQIQPSGPYYLAGQCLGGLLAYEMGCQLSENGDEIGFLGVISIAAPTVMHEFADRPLPLRLLRRGLARIHAELNILYYLPTAARRKRYRQRWNQFGRAVQDKLKLTRDASIHQNGHISQTYLQATLNYRPRPLPADMTLIRAQTQLLGLRRHNSLGWGPLVQGSLTIHILPGPNVTLLRERNLAAIGKLFGAALAFSPNPQRRPAVKS